MLEVFRRRRKVGVSGLQPRGPALRTLQSQSPPLQPECQPAGEQPPQILLLSLSVSRGDRAETQRDRAPSWVPRPLRLTWRAPQLLMLLYHFAGGRSPPLTSSVVLFPLRRRSVSREAQSSVGAPLLSLTAPRSPSWIAAIQYSEPPNSVFVPVCPPAGDPLCAQCSPGHRASTRDSPGAAVRPGYFKLRLPCREPRVKRVAASAAGHAPRIQAVVLLN
ncbi:hypothetical protein NDU88_004675 [Pleurodeles waltl]|uniref:Uncharacterized protein n=1 Tax=Pleurodeles waltl TaxID=8319 RepID=A0AAV7LJC3_PLEWA|nr:hypothetical protein NDU88_004675 [Pleurodeles waltl]